jgi:ABC-type branched-subunit amino acid transport system substrate-binding protein
VIAEYGTAVRNGIELAKKHHPERFAGVEIIFEDSQWDPKVAISAFRVLSAQRTVDLIFNWGNPTSEAVASIAEQNRIPTVVMSSDPRIAANKRYLVRTVNAADQIGNVLSKEIVRRGFHSVGIILADNSYVRGVVEGLASSLPKDVRLDVVDRVPLDTQDFRTVVSKMKVRKYDVVGVMLISGQISSFYRQMKAQDFARPSFGPDFLDSPSELSAAGPAAEGAFHPNFDVSEDFRSSYLATFGNEVQIAFAANAYDVANLVAELFGTRDANTLSGETIVDSIRAVRDYQGANGQMSVRKGDAGDFYFHYPLVIKEAKNGRSVALRPKGD